MSSNVLNVTEVKAGTELDGYDISYVVTVAAPDTELDGKQVYTSRFANKAVMKAAVMTADAPFMGFVVQVSPDAAQAAGVANLELIVKASKLDALTQIVNAPVPAAEMVAFAKMAQATTAEGPTPDAPTGE